MKKAKILLLSLFFLIMPLVSFADEELYRIYINDFSGGQNSFDIPTNIEANQGRYVKNVTLDRKGKLGKRKGISLFAQDMSDTAFTGIGRFTPSATNDYLLVASGGEVLRSTTSASWVIVNAATPASVGYDTEFIQCGDEVIVLNSVDYPPWYDGTNWEEGQNLNASPPIAATGAWFKNYLFLANDGVNRDWIYYSNNLQPRRFDLSDKVFKVNSGDGQAVIALKPFKNNELIAYKSGSVWVLDISSTTASEWTLQPVIEDIGLGAARTVVTVGNDQWFLSNDPIGVRSLLRTDLDKIKTSLVSRNIQDIFTGENEEYFLNTTYLENAAAVFFDNKYLLAITSNNSTVNDLVLLYDLIADAWYLITNWFVSDWQVFNNKLYFIDSTDGRVLRAFDADSNFDIASGPMVTPVDEVERIIASDESVKGIEWHIESKSYDFDSPDLYKSGDALTVECEPSGDYDLKVYINLDETGWQYIGSMNLAGANTSLPQDLPFSVTNKKTPKYTFPIQKYGEFKRIQVGFDNSASNEIVELRNYTIFGRKKPWRREY